MTDTNKTSNERLPLPWRFTSRNVAIADTGDYDGVIEADEGRLTKMDAWANRMHAEIGVLLGVGTQSSSEDRNYNRTSDPRPNWPDRYTEESLHEN
jgi:oligoribonuclease (3'-5' exoribonuclease)